MIRTLRSRDELQAAREALRARGLDFTQPGRLGAWPLGYRLRYRQPLPVPDFTKSWDVASAVALIEEHEPDLDAPILDMGCFNSEVLYALHALGRRRLHGCDLNPLCRWMPYWSSIRYELSDLTRTRYPDGAFGAITCLSVIEHGVPVGPLVAEARRLLRPNGLFIFTTDFDGTNEAHVIDPRFRAFGQSWRIFGRDELRALVREFEDVGFTLLGPSAIDLSHEERPIHWNDQDYTFILVAMRAPGASRPQAEGAARPARTTR